MMQLIITVSTFKSFEDILAWKKARILAKEVFAITKAEPFKYQFSLKDQLRRSSGSIMDNIAEGFERSGNKEFIQFLSISKASTSGLRSQLYRAFDQNLVTSEDFERLLADSKEISRMIQGLISYLAGSNYVGAKFKNRKPKL